MTLHIYNPEHDIALAKNSTFFTPPKAARLTHHKFCHIPAFWAEDGDWVLVDDVDVARANLLSSGRKYADVRFVSLKELSVLKVDTMPSKVEPWGWDKYLISKLLRTNPLFCALIPDEQRLDRIRRLSSREFVACEILPLLVHSHDLLTGDMMVFSGGYDDLERVIAGKKIVLKSPWSCSGRGVRFIEGQLTMNDKGWIENVIREQGVIMVEPLYDKVIDFAMEFIVDEGYSTHYLGMNIFTTNNGFYVGNVDETEDNKRNSIGKLVPMELLDIVREKIVELTSSLFKDSYSGPFGVDMMVVKSQNDEMLLHPCVELNLRRTMGHLSLI